MKRLTLLISMVLIGVLLAVGVAFAAEVQCKTPDPQSQASFSCLGTTKSDKIIGTDESDSINAKQDDDLIVANDGDDFLQGGTGRDRLYGNNGEDEIYPFAYIPGGSPQEDVIADNSDDVVSGGPSDDYLLGGYGTGGRDQVFGNAGNDTISVAQRADRTAGYKTKITRETVNCGPGEDTVYFDRGIDTIDRDTCENLFPIDPGESYPDSPRTSSRNASSGPGPF